MGKIGVGVKPVTASSQPRSRLPDTKANHNRFCRHGSMQTCVRVCQRRAWYASTTDDHRTQVRKCRDHERSAFLDTCSRRSQHQGLVFTPNAVLPTQPRLSRSLLLIFQPLPCRSVPHSVPSDTTPFNPRTTIPPTAVCVLTGQKKCRTPQIRCGTSGLCQSSIE